MHYMPPAYGPRGDDYVYSDPHRWTAQSHSHSSPAPSTSATGMGFSMYDNAAADIAGYGVSPPTHGVSPPPQTGNGHHSSASGPGRGTRGRGRGRGRPSNVGQHVDVVGADEGDDDDGEGDGPRDERQRYPCPECHKRFNRPSSLRIHMNVHTGAMPFVCPHPGCGRAFNVNSNMRRHFRTHAALAAAAGSLTFSHTNPEQHHMQGAFAAGAEPKRRGRKPGATINKTSVKPVTPPVPTTPMTTAERQRAASPYGHPYPTVATYTPDRPRSPAAASRHAPVSAPTHSFSRDMNSLRYASPLYGALPPQPPGPYACEQFPRGGELGWAWDTGFASPMVGGRHSPHPGRHSPYPPPNSTGDYSKMPGPCNRGEYPPYVRLPPISTFAAPSHGYPSSQSASFPSSAASSHSSPLRRSASASSGPSVASGGYENGAGGEEDAEGEPDEDGPASGANNHVQDWGTQTPGLRGGV
ncbi:hypothetical protein MIND_01333300 [Mycena indigotica]|uniref:C2H2-type domain-containing protein n=1 Tax=Mycena indigotica TaxID=2126181 RepID=A0A8H6VVX3_9AGAR|nr:uncharacterized protein MIND_01333300 [Mycena indigotica]KAF7290199.1 hypothetical protein MIND_01333300 [Mycena indigotica]